MILSVIIILILVFFAFMFLKLDHHAKRIKLIVLVLVILLLYFSLRGVFTSKEVDLNSPRGIMNGIYVYCGWLGQTMWNLWDVGKDTMRTVGNAIKVNSTEQTPKR